METVLESPSKTVVIGPDRPFCVIGERINPTGRKKFQAELQNGDLSRIELDVAQQVAGGADMLDVNVGDPLADEIELMRSAIPLVQGLTDLPLCIDSSVIEALEAGLGAYQGKALVNSVTGEDERLEAILPIVARHGAAVIGLANDDEIPMEPQRRLEVARKIVSAAGDHGIPPEDVLIDPLAMPVGAEPRAVTLFLETVRLIREELGVNMTCGASNTSFGLPGRETLGAAFLAVAASHGLTSAIMDARSAGDRRGRARDRLPARPRRVGRRLDRRLPQEAGGSRTVSVPEPVIEEIHPDRVRLVFQQADGATKEARVPAGTTLFDCASWNGVAIDSTCGGHGTCKKCKVRVASGRQELSTVDPRAFSPDELKAGWRLACRAQAEEDLVVEVPPLQTRPKAALAGVGRHVILRPAVQKRHLELTRADARGPGLGSRARDERDGRSRAARAARARARARQDAARRELGRDRGRGRRPAARRRARATRRRGATRSPTTSARRPASRRCSTSRPASRLAVRSILNAQQPFGADVISRISATMLDPGALDVLRAKAHETLATLTAEVCEEAGVDPAEVYEIVVAGNVTMIQLALGIDPEPLSMAPFTIAARQLPAGDRRRPRRAGARARARPCSSRRSARTSGPTSWPGSSPPA